MKNIFQGRVTIVGIGNILRSDDAFGPRLIEKLCNKIDAVCIDAGSAPENYLGKIAKENPDTVLIVDAVDLGKSPGEYALLTKEDILNSGLTTHNLSPRVFMDFLAKQTKAKIYLLGVQPESLEFSEEMSESLNKTLEKITKSIKEHFHA